MKISYSQVPLSDLQLTPEIVIHSFIDKKNAINVDWETVDSFGEEWTQFSSFSDEEINRIGSDYFDIIPPALLSAESRVLDVGCGTGRWMRYLANKVGYLEGIDPSNAVLPAAELLKGFSNVRITQATVDNIPFEDNTFDLVYSLGVLHHIPDTFKALQCCVEKVKPGGYFLVYLYYNLDNRGTAFKGLFHASNLLRRLISKLPAGLKKLVSDVLAVICYYPFILLARCVSLIPGISKYVSKIPLSYYRDKSFWIVRNDSLDRFGTPLEQRFSKEEINTMMKRAGLENIVFSETEPYWHAIGQKAKKADLEK